MVQPKIFISHSHDDDAFAERLAADLHAGGVDAWLDRADIGAGDYLEHINAALSSCEWLVIVLTPSALASSWVQHEVNAAINLKHAAKIRDLIFLRAAHVELHKLPPLWGVYNTFDATTDVQYADSMERLIKAVGGTANTLPTPVYPRKTQVVPVLTRQTLFGDVAGMTCPHCGVFNQLDEVEQLVNKAALPSTLWGSCPAQCGKCGYFFYYTPLADH